MQYASRIIKYATRLTQYATRLMQYATRVNHVFTRMRGNEAVLSGMQGIKGCPKLKFNQFSQCSRRVNNYQDVFFYNKTEIGNDAAVLHLRSGTCPFGSGHWSTNCKKKKRNNAKTKKKKKTVLGAAMVDAETIPEPICLADGQPASHKCPSLQELHENAARYVF